MKAELAPKHTQTIGNNVMIWFEGSNTYTVISNSIYMFLLGYLESASIEEYFKRFQDIPTISKKKLQSFWNEFPVFLEDMNQDLAVSSIQVPNISIPLPKISKTYRFGKTNIAIHYSSDQVMQLIHPQLAHGILENSTNVRTSFDIFLEQSILYLFKNKTFIGSYETKNFHFLQGKFAMQLLDSLYDTTESDWLATFHASTICNEDEAVMIIGDSGNGKSTLSAVLMAQGWDLLADDFTPMLANDQLLYRYPGAISIKKGAFTMIESLFEDFNDLQPQINSTKNVTVKYLPPSKPFQTAKKAFPCNTIVLVNYSREGKSELKEVASEKILQVLIPDTWISPSAAHSRLFLNWLAAQTFYELTYSDNAFAISKFEELLQRQS